MKVRWLLGLAIVVFSIMTYNVFFVSDDATLTFIGDMGSVLLAGIAVISTFICWKNIPKKLESERLFWLILSLAFFLRFLGECFWSFYEIVLKIDAPSYPLADVGWQLSYLVLVIALFYKMQQVILPNKKLIVSVTLFVAFVIAALYFYGEYSLFISTHSLLDIISNVFYVVWDIFVLALILIFVFPALAKEDKNFSNFVALALAAISFSIFDFIFARKILLGTYMTGDHIDTFYDLGYVLVIYSSYLKYTVLEYYKR